MTRTAPQHRIGAASIDERVRAALRREGEADAPTLALGMRDGCRRVRAVLDRGVAAGWARLVRRDGNAAVFAYVRGEAGR